MPAGLTLREIASSNFDSLYAWGSVPVLFLPPDGAEQASFLETPANTTAAYRMKQFGGAKPLLVPEMVVVPVLKVGRNPFSNTITVGRSGANDVQIRHSTVSKAHAWLLRPNTDTGVWRLVDCDSMNGTFINSVRIAPAEQVIVRAGDILGFGSVRALFVDASEAHELIREFCCNYRGDNGDETSRVSRPE